MKTYLIFDINKPIMSDWIIEEGNSNSDAARRYIKKFYPNKKLKASGSNFVQISSRECVLKDDKPYILAHKRQTWFELYD